MTVSGYNTISKTSLKDVNIKELTSQTNKTNINYAKIEYQKMLSDSEHSQELKTFKNFKDIRTVSPNFITENGEKVGMSDYFYIKLKKPSNFSKLQQLANQNNVQIIEQNEFMPLWYTLRCTEKTTGNTLEVANSFFETGWFSSSSPDFLTEADLACSNDPSFPAQWGLHNIGIGNANINVCDVWEITKGLGVKIAVIDNGIQLNHPDLKDNIISLSYDTESNSSPSRLYLDRLRLYNDHGTLVAGIIAAVKDNNFEMTGVAPRSAIMSISNSFSLTPNSRAARANGINWAWQNGADVINCSWTSVPSDFIDQAIENALTHGREGKGSIVVCSSGKGVTDKVGYPANSNPNIIAVGAMTIAGNRYVVSNYGDELDVVAPGSGIVSTTLNNNISTLAHGTSMAAAFVSGVAALVLSANFSLTASQIENIIEQTAQKINPETYEYTNHLRRPNGTWNNEMGYGLIDAYAAVQMAQGHIPVSKKGIADSFIKDSPNDIEAELDKITREKTLASEGFWKRNILDGVGQYHKSVYSPNRLDKIIPNPVSGKVRITYNLGKSKFAYLMVNGFYHGASKTSNKYVLEVGSQETTINMGSYLDGYYKVALVCDGKVINVKTLIKQ